MIRLENKEVDMRSLRTHYRITDTESSAMLDVVEVCDSVTLMLELQMCVPYCGSTIIQPLSLLQHVTLDYSVI